MPTAKNPEARPAQKRGKSKKDEQTIHWVAQDPRVVLDTSPVAMLITRFDGSIVYANQRCNELYGADILTAGKDIAGFYEDSGERQVILDTLRQKGRLDDHELRIRKADGSLVWALLSVHTIELEGKQVILSSLIEITGRKQAEEEKRRSEERYHGIFNIGPDAVFLISSDGHFLDANQVALDRYGYSLDEFRKMTPIDLAAPNLRERALAQVKKAIAAPTHFEWQHCCKDGRQFPVEISTQPITIDDSPCTYAEVRDITGQKMTQDALRASEEKFRTMIEQASEGFALVDEDGKIIEWNSAMAQIWGFAREEVLGQPFYEVQYRVVVPERRSPERYERLKTVITDALHTGQSPIFDRVIEAELSRPDGKRVFVEQSIFPIKTDRGYRIGSMSLDITQRKHAEETIHESNFRYQSLFDASADAIFLETVDGRIIDCNRTACDLFGYSKDEFLTLTIADLVPEEIANQLPKLITEELATGQSFFEAVNVKKDGSIFPCEVNTRLIKLGNESRILAYVQDITFRKQAEEKLNRQMERLRALHTIEQAVNSSMDLDTILKLLADEVVEQLHLDAVSILLWNDRTQRLDFSAGAGFRTQALRYTRLPIGIGLAGQAASRKSTVHIDNLALLENNPSLSKAITGESFVSYFGVPLIAKDQLLGVLEIFHRSGLPQDPEWLTFLATLAGQASIAINNARLLETTQQGLKDTDTLYRINQDLVALTDAEQLMHKVVDLLQKGFGYHYVQIFTVDPGSRDFLLRAGSGQIGKQLLSQGHRLAAGDGLVGYTAETGSPFFTNDVGSFLFYVRNPLLPSIKSELAVPIKAGNEVLGLLDIQQAPPAELSQHDVQVVTAVADQMAVALQKARLYSDLQDALRQEQAARAQLIHSERLAVAGRLLASVSHELNNPLQAIQNALFLLKDEQGISVQGRQDMKIVIAETERMSNLLERLRVTYQPTRPEDFRPVQVNELIESVFALVTTHFRHHSIIFELRPEPVLPIIPGLADQLRQVLLNLFMNSAEAMNKGGRLTVTTRHLPDSHEIFLTVKDTGTGINPGILPHIFDAFVTNKETGSGLGLSISYDIIMKHHGRIQAVNNPEGGATFSIWLPVEPVLEGGEK